MGKAAQTVTIREAIQRSEKHIIDVAMGRVRLGLPPHEVDQYLAEEQNRLNQMRRQVPPE